MVLVCALIATANIGGSVSEYVVFWSGSCSKANTMNLALHLLLNIASTGILASSNFFMQVLASPSRQEVDAAHAKRKWVDIGIPSLRNLRFLSSFKVACWVMFVLTSVPIHTVFNSAIFEISDTGSDWTLTLAAESFVNGSTYYSPGASLLAGMDTYSSYFNDSSDSSLLIRSTAANASKWIKLSTDECKTYINTCQPLTKYKDIVMLVTSDSTTSFSDKGWVPDAIFNMPTNFNLTSAWEMAATCPNIYGLGADKWPLFTDLNISTSGVGNYGDFWTQQMPLDSFNSLWFTTSCTKSSSAHDCAYYCSTIDDIEFYGGTSLYELLVLTPGVINFPSIGFLQPPPWNLTMPNGMWPYNNLDCSGLNGNHTAVTLTTSYCLAEPLIQTCMIGASGPLQLVVTICVLLKMLLSITVLCRLKGPLLVTPGDAIASFIQQPNPTTVGSVLPLLGQPRPWRKLSWSGLTAVRRSVWLLSYLFIGGIFVVVGVLFRIALHEVPIGNRCVSHCSTLQSVVYSIPTYASSCSIHPADDVSTSSIGSYVPASIAVLIANAPQLMLTAGYFTYNTLFTRLVIAREWFSYAGAARPLRVTDPRGKQVSTYRLQLPYRYSVPLLVLSIGLHWMVSNTFYIVIFYGGKAFFLKGVAISLNF